ncbi:MAG: tRNA pseudouridine(38-40) synthase TruA [Lachnospiraceae bacterium]|nr:tRNA pseudouridine(38-40) synthase TruA [Lachnospiraceae bacterium]
MRRILLRIAYDGTNYVGWQKQDNGLAVEEVLNNALHELTGENIAVIGASRTDSGVHALDNVAVFDTESRIPADKFALALNGYLPNDVVVQSSCEVEADFHPRYRECRKTYEYTIYNAAVPNPLINRYSYFVHYRLDLDAMNEAAQYLIGEHDFASFCSAGAQVKTTVREIYGVVCFAENGFQKIIIRITGSGFLYNMVRIIAGTLIQIGQGMYPPERMKEILETRDRTQAGPTAPPQGLVLKEIRYDSEQNYCK